MNKRNMPKHNIRFGVPVRVQNVVNYALVFVNVLFAHPPGLNFKPTVYTAGTTVVNGIVGGTYIFINFRV